MPVHGNTRRGLKLFPVQSREHSDIVVGSTGRRYEAVVLVDHFDEMPDDQGDGLDSLELLFGAELLSFEFDLVLLDVVFLDVQELKVTV